MRTKGAPSPCSVWFEGSPFGAAEDHHAENIHYRVPHGARRRGCIRSLFGRGNGSDVGGKHGRHVGRGGLGIELGNGGASVGRSGLGGHGDRRPRERRGRGVDRGLGIGGRFEWSD